MKNIPKVILIIETSRAFGRGLLLGITKYARLHGPWTFYLEPEGLMSSSPKLKDWHSDGIITRNSNIMEQLLKLNIPTIIVPHDPKNYPNLPAVKTDGENISKMAAEHLYNKGLKNFAFCGYHDIPWSIERKKYFDKFFNKKGFSVHSFLSTPSKRKWEKEQKLMTEWLKALPKPVGIMACNDDKGRHLIEACKIAELRIPDDIAVIGVDNDDLICDLCDPPLSSVALNVEKAGYEAAELLDKLMNGNVKTKDRTTIIVKPTHVRTRYSTDIISTEDTELGKAISYIRENFRKSIYVADVVKATALSRRTLEQRFKQKLNRSINSEITRLRIEYISSLLLETDLSISDIAYGLDFSSVEHISRYFHKETGKSLREFRKLKVSLK